MDPRRLNYVAAAAAAHANAAISADPFANAGIDAKAFAGASGAEAGVDPRECTFSDCNQDQPRRQRRNDTGCCHVALQHVVSCFARSPKAFDHMAVWPIHANDPGKTREFAVILTEKGQCQIVRSEDKRPESFKRTRA
jgi:hypothetical protein